jgi:hypothetical protein
MSRVSLLTIGTVAVLCACATTTLTSSWKDPSVRKGALQGKTVAAVFVSKEISTRRAAEVYLANDLTNRGARGIAAYTLLPDDHGDGNADKEVLRAAGVDAVVVMRIVSKDKQITYNPGSAPMYYRGGFGPYYSYGYQQAYFPPSVSTDTLVSVETLVYSLSDDKLLWASTSRTTNPDNMSALVDEVADAIAKQVGKG